MLRAGIERLGAYRIERELGTGAMGTVYRARGPRGTVALKVLHSALVGSPGSLTKLRNEAERGRRVDDPHVVRTYGIETARVEEEELGFLVMEYVEGRTLRRLLESWGKVPESLAWEIATQVAAGLAAIHAAGLVHRDLKPENVLITQDHRVRIMDLGLARFLQTLSEVSSRGRFAGTLPYAAPEQFVGGPVGVGADLYAVGVVLYELVTGSNPFAREEPAAILGAHLDMRPPNAQEAGAEVTAFFSEVIAQLLEKEPADRIPSAARLHEILRQGESSDWWQERSALLRARGPRLPQIPVERETPLHARGEELAGLATAWHDVSAGQGRVVWIEGEAGIGKTRLVDAFLRDLGAPEARVLYGSYAPRAAGGAIEAALRDHFGEADLEASLARYAPSMRTLVPALAAALRGFPPPPGAQVADPDALDRTLVTVMRGMAAAHPLVWIVEDLHFADEPSRRRVHRLAHAAAEHPVLLILTTRPLAGDPDTAALLRRPHVRRWRLGRLGARQIVVLLQDALRSTRLADRLGARVALKSDGVPFFVFEMIRELKDKGFLQRSEDGSWIESRLIEDIEVPDAVKQLIEVRVGSAGKEEREILDVGAVGGYEFDPRLVARVLDRTPIEVLQDLAHLERSSGVVRSVGRAYRFDHHQIQEVLYEGLSIPLREEIHAALADALLEIAKPEAGPASPHPELLAAACRHHLWSSRPEGALPHLPEVLTWQTAVHRRAAAAELARRALDLPGLLRGSARLEVLLEGAALSHGLGRPEEEDALLEEALVLSRADPDPSRRSRALEGRGRWLQRAARYDEATGVLEEAIQAARRAADPALELAAARTLGQVAYARGRFESSRRHHEHEHALAKRLDDSRLVARALGGIATAMDRLGRHEEARALFQRQLDTSRELGDLEGEGVASGNLGVALCSLKRPDEAAPHFRRQLELARLTGNPHGEARAIGYLAFLDFEEERFEAALRGYEREADLAREIGDTRAETLAIGNQGMCLSKLGRTEDALVRLNQWLDAAVATGNRGAQARAHGRIGYTEALLGRQDRAREHYARWLALSREIGDRADEQHAADVLSWALILQGERDEARSVLERFLALCRERKDVRREISAYQRLGRLAYDQGRTREAEAQYVRARTLASREDLGEQEGEILTDLADLLCFQGRFDAAASRLEEAEARLVAAGAEAERARVELERGRVELGRGRLESALAAFGRALQVARRWGRRADEIDALVQTARVLRDLARDDEACLRLGEAEACGPEAGSPKTTVQIAVLRATLPGGNVAEAERLLAAHAAQLGDPAQLEAHAELWQVTGDRRHLRVAGELLRGVLDEVGADHRDTIAAVPRHALLLAP